MFLFRWEVSKANMRKHRLPLLILSLTLCGGVLLLSNHNQNTIRLLAEDESYVIHLGDRVTVNSRRLSYQDEYQDVKGRIVLPDGGVYSGREFTATEHGQYQVVYEAYFGHHLETKTVTYMCQRRSSDYFTSNGSASISYGEFRHNTSKFSHQGVILDVKNGAEIKFTEPLDMEDFMIPQHTDDGKTYVDPSVGKDANSIIDFIVDPNEQMSFDFTGLTIKLTDVDNSDNYVEIRVKESGFTDYLAGALSYTKVGFSGGFLGGWEYNWQTGIPGDGKLSNTGTGLAMSFKGQPYQDILHSGQILMDYGNKRFYTYPASLSHNQVFFINDLDDPNFYKGNGWSGFSSGKCYVSITPFNFYNSTGRIIIKSIGKYSFTSDEMPDDSIPTINVDYQGHSKAALPNAVVGEYYPIFNSVVNDNYDTNLKADVSVTYRDTVNDKDIDVSIIHNRFLASKPGTYYINYSAKDRSGNVADPVTLRVDTVDTFDAVNIAFPEDSTSCYVLDEVSFPDLETITTSGGTGNINVTYEVLDPNNQVVVINKNSFKPDKVGDYKVVYSGVDYLGHTGEKTFIIHSLPLTSPKIIGHITLPQALISGFTYQFDKVKAVESRGNDLVELLTDIKVNGQNYSDSVIATGNNMTVEYIANGESGETKETFVLPVIDVSDSLNIIDQSKYFYGDMTAVMNQDDVTLSTDTNGSTLFINKLDSASFGIDLETIDGQTNYSKVKFKFIDVKDSSITVSIIVDLVNNKVSLPGFENLSYATSKINNQFSLSYNDIVNRLYDTLGNEISPIVIDDNGDTFNGFKHGIYLELSLCDVSSHSEVKVLKINNQALGYKERSGDEAKPTIRLHSLINARQTYGQNFEYPTFEAYDVLSEIDSMSMTIAKPDGTVLRGDNHMTQTFVIDAYGRYGVNYQASDKNGNIARLSNAIFVYDDVAPSLKVNSLSKDNYKVGDVVEIPTYTASDNLNKYYVDVILVLPTNEMRILTHDDNGVVTYALTDTSIYNSSFIVNNHSFRTEMKGRHTLRYVAYDDEFNTTVIELTFYVS